MRLLVILAITAAWILPPTFALAIAGDECSGNCVIQVQRTISPHGQIGKQRVPTCYFRRTRLCPVGHCVGGVTPYCQYPDIPVRGNDGWYYCSHKACR
jgi:hypothetical protein